MLIWKCPECGQETLEIDGGVAQCQSCRHNADPQDVAALNSKGEPEKCPECPAEQTFAFVPQNNESNMWACFSCGQHGEHYYRCQKCNLIKNFQVIEEGEEEEDEERKAEIVCDSCWEEIKRE